ncbi:leucoanthocyanidin dioxygenase-like [Gossypium australe]|uniref:Leucoanthocyanidin dioxygenase-like n=1 Tax=Gossypium australe TaxID=47621 RepID=A0A5B6UTB5_9ROSI|nr:leucoanthocyanidin dioxygenase-like [Gossypium australe]
MQVGCDQLLQCSETFRSCNSTMRRQYNVFQGKQLLGNIRLVLKHIETGTTKLTSDQKLHQFLLVNKSPTSNIYYYPFLSQGSHDILANYEIAQPNGSSLFAISAPLLPKPTIPTRFPPNCTDVYEATL